MQILKPDIEFKNVVQNIALLLERNVKQFGDKIVFKEKKKDVYQGISWKKFYNDILNIAFNLREQGFKKGDKMAVLSPNRLEMLELELAVMASGGISVPIYAFFHQDTIELLLDHSDAKFLAVAGETQLARISDKVKVDKLFVFDEIKTVITGKFSRFADLLKERTDLKFKLNSIAATDEICLNMYTSGTMGVPKCVQLTHGNILSQQAALEKIWKIDFNDRFLSYLPWHHSFGGIFERFSALYSGATMYLDSGYGKDPKVLIENWKRVQPTLFFSVPKVYQTLVDFTKSDKEAEELFFHSQLKFIFTAAASLPKSLSDEFEKRGITVMEGWGLTETSPCCTITDPSLKREPGVVGKPIAGVYLRVMEDGEIHVKGPNVMKGYYKNDAANKLAFSADGWFCTGDIGVFTPAGLKLISRKDRVFKLVNGEKVIPSDVEFVIQSKCHYVAFAVVVGNGKEFPVALLFPNKKLFERPTFEKSPDEGCFCPRNIEELGKCLRGCLGEANCCIDEKFSRIKAAMIIDDELSIENNTITPSMKIAPNNVLKTYKAHFENLFGSDNKLKEDVYVIRLDEKELAELNGKKQ